VTRFEFPPLLMHQRYAQCRADRVVATAHWHICLPHILAEYHASKRANYSNAQKGDVKMNTIIQASQYISDVTLELGKRLVRYTPTIFKRDYRRNRPDHISSSILVKWDDSHFLVTAGHAIKQHNIEDLGVFLMIL
jgi:hypothetical protein